MAVCASCPAAFCLTGGALIGLGLLIVGLPTQVNASGGVPTHGGLQTQVNVPPARLVADRESSALPSAAIFSGMEQGAQWVMGTRLLVAIAPPPGHDGAALLVRAFAIAQQMDGWLSDYRPTSALSQLNQTKGQQPMVVDEALSRFLRIALMHERKTEGAFSIAVGQFRDQKSPLFSRGGSAPFCFVGEHSVKLADADVVLDPGGIGKGYAVDAIVSELMQRGVTRAFVDFGGSTFFGLGTPVNDDRGWPVLLASATPGGHRGIVYLKDTALSSSSALAADGRGLARPHIVDPRTGRPIHERRYAVAISRSATDAEVLSTALIVEPALHHMLALVYAARTFVDIDTSLAPHPG